MIHFCTLIAATFALTTPAHAGRIKTISIALTGTFLKDWLATRTQIASTVGGSYSMAQLIVRIFEDDDDVTTLVPVEQADGSIAFEPGLSHEEWQALQDFNAVPSYVERIRNCPALFDTEHN
jgi:hypothetical protein